jgi:microsomal dipeptidase-like Zn-dependent dipeptidase
MMLWRFVQAAIAVAALALAGFFLLAPSFIENGANKIVPASVKVSDRAIALHKTLTIADLHSDSLLWKRSLTERSDRGHMDLPRLRDGNVALQVFSSTTKSPKGQNYDANSGDTDNITLLAVAQMQPPRTWNSLLQRSLWHAERLKRAIAATQANNDRNATRWNLVTNRGQLSGLADLTTGLPDHPRPRAALLSIEGLHNLEGKRENLDVLFKAGFRIAGFAHFFDNEVSGSMHGEKKGGLTPLGRDIFRDMEAKGMVIDIAHASHSAVAEMLAMATKPVVSSHGGVQATCKVNRNLTDDEIRGVARTGGVIGIGYWDAAVCDTSPAAIAKAIAHVRDLVGVAHVGLGSDYDGATTVGFDTSKLVFITQALIDQGFTDQEISLIMGGNVMRVLLQTLPRQ